MTCAKVVPEHATVTTVRLETYYSDYSAIGRRGHITVISVHLNPLHRSPLFENDCKIFWVHLLGRCNGKKWGGGHFDVRPPGTESWLRP